VNWGEDRRQKTEYRSQEVREFRKSDLKAVCAGMYWGCSAGWAIERLREFLVQWVAMDVSGAPNIGLLREITTPAPPDS
jgi:hypothetical protein